MRRNQRGDTLVEVTFAVAILAAVLISSLGVATRAIHLGANAGERTQLVNEAQMQMESVRAFRDNHSWDEFLNGGATYQGVLNGSGATPVACVYTTPCLHMVLGLTNPGVNESTPKPGGTLASVQTSYIELAVVQDPATPPAWVDITLSYGFKTLGGGPDSVGHIKTRLSNLRPTLAAGPCVVIPKDIIFVLDSSHSMSNVYGPGTRASEVRAISDLFIDQVSVSPAANHIAVIEFNGSPTVLSGFSSSTVALHGVMAGYNWRNAFSTQFSPALGAALTVFGGPSGRPGIEKVVIFMTDGDVNAPDNPGKAKAAADVLKAAGVQLYTVGIASPPPPAVNLLTSMATSAAYYNDAASATDLQAIMAGLAISLGC